MLFNTHNKRIVKYIFILLVYLSFSATKTQAKTKILSSFYPIHILTEGVVNGIKDFSTSLMLPSTQGCPHEYMLTVGDMKKLSQADVFIVNGMGLERFTLKTVKSINERIHIVTASENIVPLYSRENINPHAWVSPLNAAKMVEHIALALGRIYPANSDKFIKNAKNYAGRLRSSFQIFREEINTVKEKQIFTYNNVFDYLFHDLGFHVVGVVEKHHGERPSAGELRKIIRLIMKKQVKTIIYSPSSPKKVIGILAEETNIKAFSVDPLASGENLHTEQYLRVMKKNMQTLTKAFGK